MVCRNPSVGKTALLAEVTATEGVVVEDAHELRPCHPDSYASIPDRRARGVARVDPAAMGRHAAAEYARVGGNAAACPTLVALLSRQ